MAPVASQSYDSLAIQDSPVAPQSSLRALVVAIGTMTLFTCIAVPEQTLTFLITQCRSSSSRRGHLRQISAGSVLLPLMCQAKRCYEQTICDCIALRL